MNPLAPIHKLDRLQQRNRVSAVICGTIRKFNDDQASNLAAVVAFYAFFSLFPLLLVFVTVLGYVLSGDHSLLVSVRNSVLGRFPVIGPTLKHDTLKGSVPALVVGVVLTLYSGLGVTGAAHNALDHIWGTPRHERANFIKKKLNGLILVASLGLLFVVASAASGIVSGGLGGPLLLVFGLIVGVLLNVVLFLLSFRLLASEPVNWSQLLPGAALAAVFWTLLQSLGGAYIGHISSNNTYGTFALVLGVVAWLHLGSQATLYSAELNTVLAKRLWPRALLGPGDEDPSADEGEPDGRGTEPDGSAGSIDEVDAPRVSRSADAGAATVRSARSVGEVDAPSAGS